MINEKQLNELKEKVAEFDKVAETAEGAAQDKEAVAKILSLAKLAYLLQTIEPAILPQKQKSKMQAIIHDTTFMTFLLKKLSETEGKDFKKFSDFVRYTEVLDENETEKRFETAARLIGEHDSLQPMKDGKLILLPEEIMERVEALNEVEDFHDAMAEIYSEAFEKAPAKHKCLFCKRAKGMDAMAVFAYCLRKALLSIYTPVEMDGQYFIALVTRKGEGE